MVLLNYVVEVLAAPDLDVQPPRIFPSNDVSVVDLATDKEVIRVKVGSSPWGLVIVVKSS